jgi:hypothetical protein
MFVLGGDSARTLCRRMSRRAIWSGSVIGGGSGHSERAFAIPWRDRCWWRRPRTGAERGVNGAGSRSRCSGSANTARSSGVNRTFLPPRCTAAVRVRPDARPHGHAAVTASAGGCRIHAAIPFLTRSISKCGPDIRRPVAALTGAMFWCHVSGDVLREEYKRTGERRSL